MKVRGRTLDALRMAGCSSPDARITAFDAARFTLRSSSYTLFRVSRSSLGQLLSSAFASSSTVCPL